jgi:hypothetical protein
MPGSTVQQPMQLFPRPFGSMAELHHNELECFRHMPDKEVGVLAAFHYCSKHRISPPDWVTTSAATVLINAFGKRRRKNRGRSSNVVDRIRQNLIHFERYDTVLEIREKQLHFADMVKRYRGDPKIPKAILEEKEKFHAWVGSTLERAYECASMILRDTISFGGPDAIKASYLKCGGECRNRALAMRYHILDSSLIRALGIELDRPQVRKHVPLFDLTL